MTPPAAARWLLDRLLDRAAAEAIGGDLAEEFARRVAAGQSRLAAGAWFWRQTVIATVWWWLARARRAPSAAAGRRSMIEALWTDARQTIRALSRSPGFALGAIVPLALAIALGTAVFAAVHAVLLRPLPFPNPDRLFAVGEQRPGAAIGNVGYETFVDLRGSTSFDGFAAVRSWAPTLTSPATVRLTGLRVTSGFFSMLGVRPALGRDFTPADDTPDTRRVLILSDAVWRLHFGADPAVIDRTIELNEIKYRVVGVMPPDYEPVVSSAFYSPAEIWAPLGYAVGGDSTCRGCRHLRALASLKPGISPDAAEEELRSLHASLAKQFPADYDTDVAGIERLSSVLARPMAPPLYLLFGAVVLVLAIAAANAASLMLARAADREHERALRAALGASSVHLVRQRVVEAVLLAGTAGAIGLVAGQTLTSWLVTHAPVAIPRAAHIGLNADVFLFTVAGVLLSTAMIALVPIVSGAVRPITSAAAAPGRTTDGRALVRARELLIVADVAIALMLALGAGAMVRSLDQLLDVDPGFESTDVHTFAVSLVGPRWAEDEPVRAFQRDLLARMRSLPGVDDVAVAGQVPLGGNYDTRGGYLEERQTDRAEDGVDFQRYSVSPDYLRVMGIPLKRGRFITDADRQDGPRVMVINETAARTYWPGQDPIGRRVRFGSDRTSFVTVVGIVGDVRHLQLDQPPDPQMYMPQEQVTDSFLVVTIKTARFDELLPAIREAVRVLGPDVPVYDVRAMDSLVADSAATRRFTAVLLGVFAAVATVMTAVGLYALVAYAVSRRTREFGIRIALGAPKAAVRHLVLRRGLLLVGAGGGVGIICAMPLAWLLREQLYETSALDGPAVAFALATLLATSAIAHAIPMARATRVSPTITLRGD